MIEHRFIYQASETRADYHAMSYKCEKCGHDWTLAHDLDKPVMPSDFEPFNAISDSLDRSGFGGKLCTGSPR
jgi:hypothetical protein